MKTPQNTPSTATGVVTVYGIPNCDTVRKSRNWLTEYGVEYVFHDFKKQGVPTDLLPGWINAVGLDKLINRKGPTWRKIDAASQASVVDAASATAVILANASVIKRPLVVWADGSISVGFDAAVFAGHVK